jgi:hypothetical protein
MILIAGSTTCSTSSDAGPRRAGLGGGAGQVARGRVGEASHAPIRIPPGRAAMTVASRDRAAQSGHRVRLGRLSRICELARGVVILPWADWSRCTRYPSTGPTGAPSGRHRAAARCIPGSRARSDRATTSLVQTSPNGLRRRVAARRCSDQSGDDVFADILRASETRDTSSPGRASPRR